LRSRIAGARVLHMEVQLKYRGREITACDVAFIRALIAEDPGASRRALSKKLCEAWNWVQPNVSMIMIIDGVIFKVFDGSVRGDAKQEQNQRPCRLLC
jgi:hypothetical protein